MSSKFRLKIFHVPLIFGLVVGSSGDFWRAESQNFKKSASSPKNFAPQSEDASPKNPESKNLKNKKSQSTKKRKAELIRDELFKCNVTSKLYDPLHYRIIKKTKLRDMSNIRLALCSTKRTNLKSRYERINFMKSIVAVMNWVNACIIEQRNFVLSVKEKRKNRVELSNIEKDRFSKICSFYRTRNIDELLNRVAPIPLSLAVSQAILESGYGSNPVIYRNNAFFGMMKNSEYLHSFSTLLESAIAYSKTLNVHSSYKNLRKQRSLMIAKSQKIDGKKLAGFLGVYSTNQKYHQLILQLMEENNLQLFDTKLQSITTNFNQSPKKT